MKPLSILLSLSLLIQFARAEVELFEDAKTSQALSHQTKRKLKWALGKNIYDLEKLRICHHEAYWSVIEDALF